MIALKSPVSRLTVKVKTRKCPICETRFEKRSMTHNVCSPACAIEAGARKKAAIARRDLRRELIGIKPRSVWLREAQAVFNAFIRQRDINEPCISCGRFHTGSYDAGHYRSVGAMPALRFNEDNVHRQCVPCNQFKSGNIVEYRLRLACKIGQERLAELETDHPVAKYTIDDAKAIKATYRAKLALLKADK